MNTEAWTLRRLIATSSAWLKERGVEGARREVEELLGHVLGLDRVGLFLNLDRPVDESERTALRALIARRGRQEPLAYLVGSAGFWTFDVKTDARALIPRPETELLVEQVLAHLPMARRQEPLRVVDVGTGTGVLAIALAKELPNATVVALDLSADALELARENVEANGVQDRVHLVQGDLLERLVRKGSQADVIVSNPPYVGESERMLMGPGVAEWEPAQALFAGCDGFAVIDRLLPQVRQVLAPGGVFVMEFGSPQGERIRQRAASLGLSWQVLQDLAGLDRVLVLRAGEASNATELELDREALQQDREARNAAGLLGGELGDEPLPVIDMSEL